MNSANIAYWRARGFNALPPDWPERYQIEKSKRVPNVANRARQLNPACTEFWKSRGYDYPPWRWDCFEGSFLADAHEWPPFLDGLEAEGTDYANQWNGWSDDQRDAFENIVNEDSVWA